MATITLYELSNYNNARLCAETFDLDLIDNNSEFEAAVYDWLADLWAEHVKAGIVDIERNVKYEEWIIADTEDVPEEFVGDYSFDADAWGEYKAACNEMGEEVVDAFIACFGEWDMDNIQDRYMGFYERSFDLGYEMLEGYLSEIPEVLHGYIDFESYARDLRLSGEVADYNGHYFRTY